MAPIPSGRILRTDRWGEESGANPSPGADPCYAGKVQGFGFEDQRSASVRTCLQATAMTRSVCLEILGARRGFGRFGRLSLLGGFSISRRIPLGRIQAHNALALAPREMLESNGAQLLVSVMRISAYQAVFSPSASSSPSSRVLTSTRAECTPRSFHGSPPSASSGWATLRTTGAPLLPRCVRASVRK